MKKIILTVILLLFTFKVYSAEPLACYKIDSVWHFVDVNGDEMFRSAEVENLAGYREGFFLITRTVQDTTQWAFMDTTGTVKIIPDAAQARLFREGRAITVHFHDPDGMDRTYGYINKKGEQVVPPKYLDAIDYYSGKAYIMNKEERGYVDKKGDWLFKLDTLVGYVFNEGMAPVSNKKGKFGFINDKGEVVIDMNYDEAKPFHEGLAAVNTKGKFGFINKKGEWGIKPSYEFAQEFSDGYCFVAIADKNYEPLWGVINKKGYVTVNFKYKDASGFSMGIGTVKDDDSWYFIDTQGNKVIDKEFTYADEFIDGLAWASDKEAGKYGFIDPLGNYQVELPGEAEFMIDLRANRRVF